MAITILTTINRITPIHTKIRTITVDADVGAQDRIMATTQDAMGKLRLILVMVGMAIGVVVGIKGIQSVQVMDCLSTKIG